MTIIQEFGKDIVQKNNGNCLASWDWAVIDYFIIQLVGDVLLLYGCGGDGWNLHQVVDSLDILIPR
jgi:hypothetical protein